MVGSTALTTALWALVVSPWLSLALPTSNGRPTVTIDTGVVVGINKTENSTGMPLQAFLGVPFAAQPVRFGPPKKAARWSTPFDASKYGPACIQQFNYPESRRNLILKWFNNPAPAESEDCLNACIYVPLNTTKTSKKTVMVWYYGGGLNYGSNAMPLYDGSTLAAHEDVIVVAVNYVWSLSLILSVPC
jgi:carboxylesterase type B